jgi:hypothetical protein
MIAAEATLGAGFRKTAQTGIAIARNKTITAAASNTVLGFFPFWSSRFRNAQILLHSA